MARPGSSLTGSADTSPRAASASSRSARASSVIGGGSCTPQQALRGRLTPLGRARLPCKPCWLHRPGRPCCMAERLWQGYRLPGAWQRARVWLLCWPPGGTPESAARSSGCLDCAAGRYPGDQTRHRLRMGCSTRAPHQPCFLTACEAEACAAFAHRGAVACCRPAAHVGARKLCTEQLPGARGVMWPARQADPGMRGGLPAETGEALASCQASSSSVLLPGPASGTAGLTRICNAVLEASGRACRFESGSATWPGPASLSPCNRVPRT